MQAVPEEVQGPIDGNTQSGDLRSVSVLRDPTPASPANNQDGVENDTEEDADSDQVESIRSDEDTQGTGDDETGSEEDRIGGEDDKSGDGEYIPTEDREGTPASNVVTRLAAQRAITPGQQEPFDNADIPVASQPLAHINPESDNTISLEGDDNKISSEEDRDATQRDEDAWAQYLAGKNQRTEQDQADNNEDLAAQERRTRSRALFDRLIRAQRERAEQNAVEEKVEREREKKNEREKEDEEAKALLAQMELRANEATDQRANAACEALKVKKKRETDRKINALKRERQAYDADQEELRDMKKARHNADHLAETKRKREQAGLLD